MLGRLLLVLPVVAALIGGARAEAMDPSSPQRVERDLRTFFQAYLGRPLTEDEAAGTAQEFLTHFGSERCEAPCQEALESHLRIARDAFGGDRGAPEARVWRQAYLTLAAFADPPTGPTWMRLFQEPDPIVLTHPLSKRVMTRDDIAALADLTTFIENGGAPVHRQRDPDEMARFTEEVTQLVGPNARRMPAKATLAAELFAGLQVEWDSLSAEERELLRAYLGGEAVSLPEALLARVLHVPLDDARQIQSAEALDAQFASFYANLDEMRRAMYGALGEYGTLAALMAATP